VVTIAVLVPSIERVKMEENCWKSCGNLALLREIFTAGGVRPWMKLAGLTITAKYASVWMRKGLSFATSATSLKRVDVRNGKD